MLSLLSTPPPMLMFARLIIRRSSIFGSPRAIRALDFFPPSLVLGTARSTLLGYPTCSCAAGVPFFASSALYNTTAVNASSPPSGVLSLAARAPSPTTRAPSLAARAFSAVSASSLATSALSTTPEGHPTSLTTRALSPAARVPSSTASASSTLGMCTLQVTHPPPLLVCPPSSLPQSPRP